MILTKRPEEALLIADQLPWPPHLLMGVSVENADHTGRIDVLRQIPALNRFLSMEPLLGARPRHRPDPHRLAHRRRRVRPRRPRDARKNGPPTSATSASGQQVPFHFKQWGGIEQEEDRPPAGRTHLGPVPAATVSPAPPGLPQQTLSHTL